MGYMVYTSNKVFKPSHHALRSDSEDLLHWMPLASPILPFYFRKSKSGINVPRDLHDQTQFARRGRAQH